MAGALAASLAVLTLARRDRWSLVGLIVAMIGFALFLTPYFDPPIMALAWAVLAGGLAQLLYQLPHLKKIGMLVLPRLSLRHEGAPGAVVANDDRFGQGIELGEAVEDLVHRHKSGPFYPGEGELPRLPDVEQDRSR